MQRCFFTLVFVYSRSSSIFKNLESIGLLVLIQILNFIHFYCPSLSDFQELLLSCLTHTSDTRNFLRVSEIGLPGFRPKLGKNSFWKKSFTTCSWQIWRRELEAYNCDFFLYGFRPWDWCFHNLWSLTISMFSLSIRSNIFCNCRGLTILFQFLSEYWWIYVSFILVMKCIIIKRAWLWYYNNITVLLIWKSFTCFLGIMEILFEF